MKKYKVLIIGAGPAGIAAAIYLQRAGVDFILVEKSAVGGLIVNANCVENYPGFPNGISGVKFAELLRRHIQRWKILVHIEEILRLDFSNEVFIAETTENIYLAEYVIRATGTEPKQIEISGSCDVDIQLISYEIRQILTVSGERIAIVGAGDAAFDYALTLSERNSVLILNRTDSTKCLSLLKERVKKIPKIEYRSNITISKISQETGILTLHFQQNVVRENVHRLVIAIGREARANFLENNLCEHVPSLREQNRFFTVGDAVNGDFRQTSIAVGDGVRAAMSIISILNKNENYCTN